jgi:competence protein ComEC
MALEIHFLNVGHGDCTVIDLPSGRLMMIDINNSKSLPDDDVEALAENKGMSTFEFSRARSLAKSGTASWEDYYRSLLVDPADYYTTHFSGRSIFRYIQTHPDMDHMGGLHSFFWEKHIELENFWDVAHVKKKEKSDFDHSPYSYVDWVVYTLLRDGYGPGVDGKGIEKNHRVLKNLRGGSESYWEEDGIEILSPTQALIDDCNANDSYNNCSYVIKINYAGRTIILPGDAEMGAWKSVLDNPGPDSMNCDILKAAHHGRESGYCSDAVEAMSPELVICSVGKKPSTDASDEYASHGATVLSTRYHGTITAKIWHDGDIWVDNYKGDRILTIT